MYIIYVHTGINAMEAEVEEMKKKVAETNAAMEAVKSETTNTVETTKAEAAAEIKKIKEEAENMVQSFFFSFTVIIANCCILKFGVL